MVCLHYKENGNMKLPTIDKTDLYDEYYFKHSCGPPYERNERWLQFFGGIAEEIVKRIRPRTVLDAGCAMGMLVEALRDRGVEAFGIDISEYALSRVRDDIRPYCSYASILDALPQKYDLIVCIEVLEHLSAADAGHAIANMCKYSDDILFSSTPLDYREVTHFNIQPPEYWVKLFAYQGFFRDVDFDASFILPWAVRFRKAKDPVTVISGYERHLWRLAQENIALREVSIELRNCVVENERSQQTLMQQLDEKEQSLYALKQQLEEKEQSLYALKQQLEVIMNSHSWLLVLKLQRVRSHLTPPGTGRERLLRASLRALNSLKKMRLHL